jgi:cell wall-associated NlpC family hydrolase
MLTGLLAACGHEPVRKLPQRSVDASHELPERRSAERSRGDRVAAEALRQVGMPYRFGGSTRNGFDCSGLMQYAYSAVSTRIPRTAAEQYRLLPPVAERDLRVGDLLFFNIDGRIAHVGMYLGNRRFVHAPATGREVTIAELDSSYYRQAFVRAGRPE